MTTLGGTMITYNLERYDFPYKQAIQSLCDVCDEVVILDCGSTDGTLEKLQEGAILNTNLEIHTGGDWNVRDDRTRLPMLSNEALSHLDTDWHLAIQADEVLHEKCYDKVRELVERNDQEGYVLRRVNMWGEMDLHFRDDYPMPPCGHRVNRLARTKYPYFGDAENLAVPNPNDAHMNDIVLFHYSYVRKPEIAIDKAIWMTGWFWGTGVPDPRLVEQRERCGTFRGLEFHNRDALVPIPMDHPSYMKEWADERRPLLEGVL